jgi:hypothetical protein
MNEGQSTRDGEELAFLREGLTPLPLLFSLEELKKVGGGKMYGARNCDVNELVTRGEY